MDFVARFPYIKPSLHPWDEAYLVMIMTILMCSWNQFVRILLNIFALIFVREIGLKFSFLVESLGVLDIRVILAS